MVFLRLAKQKPNGLEAWKQIEDDLANSCNGQGQDQARQTPELAEEKEGKDSDEGVYTDLRTNYIRCDQISFHNVYKEEYTDDSYGIPGGVFGDQRDKKREGAADKDADIGYDNEDAAQESKEKWRFDAEGPESDRIEGADNGDDL